MDSEDRFDLVARNTEEVVTPEELRQLLHINDHPRGYIGFEPSGLAHIGWVICSNKVRDFLEAGFEFTIFFADWHAYINDKLGGDLESIRTCARYMEDCFEALGVPGEKVEYEYATQLLSDIDYWERVINIGKVSSLSRVKRAMTIMGRQEDEAEVDSSKVMYPLMQATDIFALEVDVAYAGIDQRRAHMLAREAAEKMGWRKPVAVHTPLLPGLKGGSRMDPLAAKMSKSDPDSGITLHDTPDDIRRKVKKAFCPPEVEGNPVLGLCKHLIFPRVESMFIDRPEKFGGPLEFPTYREMEEAYAAGELHPMDLKKGAAQGVVEVLAPVREYFERKPENLERMREILG
ncbi:MAG: tyrosine--tRNA ligase [Methanomassiliicoccales archaeon]